jgi:hypothetical protein
MTKEEMTKRLNELNRARFLLAMKDYWSRADFDRDDEMRAEMLKLEKALEKF